MKAASIPASTRARSAPSAATSTSVPSHGCARRIVTTGTSAMRKRAFVDEQQPPHAFGDVAARQRRAGDIANVGVELDRIARALARELAAPRRQTDRVAVRFAI